MTVNQTPHEALIEKIQKCLALSTSPNLNEAAAAMEMAQKLMTKYNIELYQVEQHTGKRNEEIVSNNFDLGVGRGSPVKWRQDLIFAIARHNFCRGLAYTGRQSHGRMTIVGEPHNIEIVKFFYNYLSTTVDRLADEGYDQSEAKTVYPKMRALGHTNAWYWSSRSWKNAFRVKAIEVLDARLWSLRRTLDTTTTALVVTKEQQVKDKLKELFPNTVKAEKSTIYNIEGANSGVDAAKKIALNVPVQTGVSTMALR